MRFDGRRDYDVEVREAHFRDSGDRRDRERHANLFGLDNIASEGCRGLNESPNYLTTAEIKT